MIPQEIILIAAVTVDGYVARHSLEVTSWSLDLELFKKQTTGYPVIMGSNTQKTLYKDLVDRKTIIVNRGQNPEEILGQISSSRCFIIGGGKTYYLFAPFLTHLYITPHPYVFGKGIPLFDGYEVNEMSLVFEKMVEFDKPNGVFQYQYKVIK